MTPSPLPPAPSPQQIHLGALVPEHNTKNYTLRLRLALDFRANGMLTHARLDTLDDTGFSAELLLYGRWQQTLAALRRGALLQLDNLFVVRNIALPGSVLRLELRDPPPRSDVAVHVLTDRFLPVAWVCGQSLAAGLTLPDDRVVRRFGGKADSGAEKRTARVSVGETGRKYVYESVAGLWERSAEGGAKGERANIYGVVIECRAPCVTKGPDLRCEVIVADESSLEASGKLRTVVIYRFERDPDDAIPFRAVGDIIRAHRIHVGRYRDASTGTVTLQGVGRFYSTFLLWSVEGEDYLPIASRAPVQVGSASSHATSEITHLVSSQDREKVSSLRRFSQRYVLGVHRIGRPFLRSVVEVRAAYEDAPFMTKSFDLICSMISEYADAEDPGALKFLVTDGMQPEHRLLVESEVTPEHAAREPRKGFVDYCPSWPLRPRTRPAWLLIRDARVQVRGGERFIKLSVGRKTSTLVWQSEGAPDVRRFREMYARAVSSWQEQGGRVHAANRPGADVHISRAYAVGAPHAGHSVVQASSQGAQAPAVLRQQATEAQRPFRAVSSGIPPPPPPPLPPPRMLLARSATGTAALATARSPNVTDTTNSLMESLANVQTAASVKLSTDSKIKTPPPANALTTAASKATSPLPSAPISPPPRPFDESRVGTVPADPTAHTKIITTHTNKSQPIRTILELQTAVARGEAGPFRLCVGARSFVYPRDPRLACRPWCRACARFLKTAEKRLTCLGCGAEFRSSQDEGVAWAFAVRLSVDDGSSGRLDLWVEGEEGAKFFRETPARDLRNEGGAEVLRCLRALLSARCRLDCCVMPYEFMDADGVYHIAAKVFGTALLMSRIADI